MDCGNRLYVPEKRLRARCYDCQCKHLGVDFIGYTPSGLTPEPKGYFEVSDDNGKVVETSG